MKLHLSQVDDISTIREGLKQVFQNKFTLNIGQKEIIKMKNEGVLTERDLNMAKFLFEFRFATLNQIYNFLNAHGDDSSISSVKNRLNKLVEYRIVNKFMLTEDLVAERITPDALEIFCLDLGGRYLLAHYSNEDTTDWYTTENMKDSGIINKNLAATEFYLSLINTCKDKVAYFNIEPDIRVGKKNVIPSFDMCIDVLGNKNYFVGEIIREFDFPVYFREKAYKLELLFESNAWKKYYYDAPAPPVLFLVADSDITAFEASRLITEATGIRRFRATTDDRLKKPLYEAGAFLRYSEDEEILEEIKSTTFLP